MWGVARRLSLTQRVVAIVAVAIVPAAAALPYFIVSIHRERASEVRDLALRTSQFAALEMERIVSGAEGVLQTLAYAPVVRTMQSPACDDYLAEVSRRLPQLRGFAVADAAGLVHCSAGLTFAANSLADESWFDAAIHAEDDFVVGEYTGTRPDEAAYLPVALPIRTDGQLAAVVVTGVDLAWLGARLRERNLAQGSALAIADRNGVLIAREPDSERFVGTRIADQFLPLVHADRPGTIELTSQDGTRRILGYQPPAATGIGLYVGAGVSTEAAFGPIYASTWRSVAVAAAGAVAACTVAWFIGDRLFRRPIHRLLATIASWRAGDVTARTGIAPGGSELSALANSIDEYMDSLVAIRAARAAAEDHRALVLREMNHRIKNILAAVQAVANQTFKDKATPDSLRTFRSRLTAMAATHDLLVTENWESVDLHHTLTAALAPFGLGRERRFTLEGPPLRIASRAALALSMALHELCTNAAKYGALSVPGGEVALHWQVVRDDGPTRFLLTWKELNGPPVPAPRRTGFGTRLIEAALASEFEARADLRFPVEGVQFTLDAAAERILADPDDGTEAAPAA